MLFGSLEFAVFLPTVFLLYWFVFGKNANLQNAFLIAASYFFYAWCDVRFLGLILFASFCTWASALLIERSRRVGHCAPPPFPEKDSNRVDLDEKSLGTKKKNFAWDKFFCGANVVALLCVLGFFKYYDFFAREFAVAFLGGNADGILLKIVLPVGISFYTFSALSYTIDAYRGNVKTARNPLDVFAYLSFFPQLLAGPIGRASELLPQYRTRRVFEYAPAADGARQMLWGFFKKMVLADNCAKVVDTIWADWTAYSGSALAVAAVLYTIQIYCDFSGYSDIAIGCAKLFGIKLRQNFLFPYFSRNVAEFWRRWHISLNTWFRDYLYIPLGGSREGTAKTIRNTLIVFAVCGFWHGANWTFLAWGIFHGLLFIPLLLAKTNKKNKGSVVAENSFFPSFKEVFQIAGTFLLITIGWVLFRAPTIHDAFGFFEHMLFSGDLFSSPHIKKLGCPNFIFFVILFGVEWLARRREHALACIPFKKAIFRWTIYLALGYVVFCYGGNVEQFVYSQF